MNTDAVYSPETLHARFGKIAALGVIVGDFGGVRALRVARLVWERHPALFPAFASELADTGNARSACWSLAQICLDVVGAFDVWAEATAIAAGEEQQISA